MPFKSEAQRRYMWATMPAIAKAWEEEMKKDEDRSRDKNRKRMRRLMGKDN